MVEVVDGTLDLYVEHRGAGPAKVWPADLVLGELRQLGSTKVTTMRRSTDLSLAMFLLDDCDRPLAGSRLHPGETAGSVGKANPLSFTLAGEYVEDIN